MAPTDTISLKSVSVGPHELTKNVRRSNVIWSYDGEVVPTANVATEFELGNRQPCEVLGKVDGGSAFSLSVRLLYK